MKTNANNGSFNIPKDLLNEVNKVKEKSGAKVNDAEEVIENFKKEKIEDGPEKAEVLTEEEKNEKLLEDIRKSLNIEISDDDLWNVLFNSALVKEKVEIYPGRVYASFKYGLSVDELADVDHKMALAVDSKLMETGFKSLNTRHLLSHVLLQLGKPDNIKSIGQNPEERFKEIGNMNSLLVEMLAKKWNMFLFLIDEMMKKDETLKKQ